MKAISSSVLISINVSEEAYARLGKMVDATGRDIEDITWAIMQPVVAHGQLPTEENVIAFLDVSGF
jgi:hypothetical protein